MSNEIDLIVVGTLFLLIIGGTGVWFLRWYFSEYRDNDDGNCTD